MQDMTTQMKEIMRGVKFEDKNLQDKMEQELLAKLEEGRPLVVKLGVDPTSHGMHLGHTVPFQKLRQFQNLGHNVVFLIGDFTARIGDPTGETKTRPAMAKEDIWAYATHYQEQAAKILDMQKVEVQYNSNWLRAIPLEEIISLTSTITLNRLLATRHFSERFARKDPIYIHEILYPVLQGYDSVVLDADIEVGGSDQLSNMLVGRDLQRSRNKPSQVVLLVPLLTGTDGVHIMSKRYENTIELTCPPNEMYGKVMSIPDDLIVEYFTLATAVPMDEIAAIETGMASGDPGFHPRDMKMKLAREIVSIYHGLEVANESEKEFVTVHRERSLPTAIPEISLSKELVAQGRVTIVELLTTTQLVRSNSQARRLISQGGVRVDGAIVTDFDSAVQLKDGTLIQIGRRKFVRIKV
jgi:tyrosyl-tRNA synthetase